MYDLRYPIGQYQSPSLITSQGRQELLLQLAEAPDRLRTSVEDLSPDRLDTPYRPGGWTVRQVVHHLADSHLNWYVRTKLALTEAEPLVKPFDENLWAELPDARFGPIKSSVLLLDGLHKRWAQLFESLEASDWVRKMIHPERGALTLDAILPMIAWHGRHHTAHITELRKRMSWQGPVSE
jgi:uncharacterized damage-inducible protein DinB